MRKIVLLLIVFYSLALAKKDTVKPDSIITSRITEVINIDGILSEEAWQKLPVVSDFTQREPDEGEPPTQQTQVRIGYDDNNLYIGARMYDSSPDSIVARLSRRDDWQESDAFGFYIDPYLDHRSGFYFVLNAAGTYFDGVMLNDDWDDDSWDGVWEGKVRIDNEGWTAEMRIPLSQLRFQEKEEYLWGVNFRRYITRNRENDFVAFTPRNGSGFVSRFPVLRGITNISPTKQVEILPYVRNKSEYLQTEAGSPFDKASRFKPGLGADVKIALSHNLTLDATINPDFGQVEVDPAVVNLSDVETFFEEKRPFFIEGSQIFSFGRGGSRSNWSFNWGNPNFFYSRRIGRAPQGSLPDHDYASVPDGTSIIGAAKLSGKIGEGWNIGMLNAVTMREYAELDNEGNRFEAEVEPATYYGVMRAQKEFDKGFQGLGFIGTGTHRFFKDERLKNDLNEDALVLGTDGWTFLDKNRVWVLTGWLGMSHLRGSKERITNLQRSSIHYLQRPDAENYSLDSNATSMTGYAGRFMLNKQKGNFYLNSAIGFIDPRFDVNDLGFIWRGNVVNGHVAGGYKWTKPVGMSRYSQLNFSIFGSTDFDNNITFAGIWHGGFTQFMNYCWVNWNIAFNPETISNRTTRGGPLMKQLGGVELNLWTGTDNSKEWSIQAGTNNYFSKNGGRFHRFEIETEWKPSANLTLRFSPEFVYDQTEAQYVAAIADPTARHTFGKRYLFARLYQRTLAASLRLNWTFTPELSLQVYVQPLFSSGDYTRFKELAKPRSFDFNNFNDANQNGTNYTVDPDGNGPASTISWSDPDFNFKSVRGNAVLRWEYMPGSTLYFAWTQSRFDYENVGLFQFRKSFDRVWETQPDNIFMVKATYWLSI